MRQAQWGLARLLILNARALSHPELSTLTNAPGAQTPCAPHSCVQRECTSTAPCVTCSASPCPRLLHSSLACAAASAASHVMRIAQRLSNHPYHLHQTHRVCSPQSTTPEPTLVRGRAAQRTLRALFTWSSGTYALLRAPGTRRRIGLARSLALVNLEWRAL